MKPKLCIVKIGGNVIDNEAHLDSFLLDFAKLDGPKILVHGGGKRATEISEKLGIKTEFNKGRRITTAASLEVITMVYAGLNKLIVSKLQAANCNALGLSGADGDAITSDKRPSNPFDFGFAGDVKKVNYSLIKSLVKVGVQPVFCAITHDGNGQLLNTNADTIATEIAIGMSQEYATELIYCFEKNGVLEDVNDSDSVISKINKKDFEDLLKAEKVHDGMLPKLENAFHALDNNVEAVRIKNYASLSSNDNTGTQIAL